ncbi:hypothetical protein [Peribacillus frigoritolerans]|uniref:hypothetical protein n=1 Tax=Peribacillus frigoritolerans TaxID=450367 RepID=UPI0024C1DD2A|nr:hypothetical protein [Peribacillus frigoritolerans]WHX60914.1 hypothetical protein QNH33_20215 [Peribacillus frigoritolerans]
MELYIELFVFLAIIFLIVLSNRFIPWLVKAAIAVYYSVISYIFITTKNKIDERYENITPVPDAYWDKNSAWVDTMTGYYLWSFLIILLFIYIKWFTSVKSKEAKGWVLISFIPSLAVFYFAYSYSVFHTGIDHRGWILPDIQLQNKKVAGATFHHEISQSRDLIFVSISKMPHRITHEFCQSFTVLVNIFGEALIVHVHLT